MPSSCAQGPCGQPEVPLDTVLIRSLPEKKLNGLRELLSTVISLTSRCQIFILVLSLFVFLTKINFYFRHNLIFLRCHITKKHPLGMGFSLCSEIPENKPFFPPLLEFLQSVFISDASRYPLFCISCAMHCSPSFPLPSLNPSSLCLEATIVALLVDIPLWLQPHHKILLHILQLCCTFPPNICMALLIDLLPAKCPTSKTLFPPVLWK